MTRATNSGQTPETAEDAPVPTERKLADGQFADHWVLSAEERAKGFVRPVRLSYRHVGTPGPAFPLRDLTDDERAQYGDHGYVKFEPYPEGYHGSACGRFWTQPQLDTIGKGCGVVTSMPRAIAETYARLPGYYGSTFCCGCGDYFKVGRSGEFVWDDGAAERVGT
jgi:hypothetical protein